MSLLSGNAYGQEMEKGGGMAPEEQNLSPKKPHTQWIRSTSATMAKGQFFVVAPPRGPSTSPMGHQKNAIVLRTT